MSDMLRALAFAFRRKGADIMLGSDLRMLLAYDLRWFAPEDAKRVVARGLESGLLVAQGDHVKPAFDIKSVEIPVNFRPTTLVLDESPPSFTAAAAPAPPPATASPPVAAPSPTVPALPSPAAPPPAGRAADGSERAAEDERRRRGLLMSIEVARLMVRRRAGEDVAADAAVLEAALIAKRAPPT